MAEFPGSIVPEKIRLQSVADPIFRQAGVELAVLRLDEIHPDISGNKWFKLKYNLRQALESGHDTVLSFGGTWSNHLHALAAAGKKHGLRTIGVVRGDDGGALTPCLQDARRWGMQLHFVSREAYRYKQESQFIAGLAQHFGEFYLVPEGGSNLEGIRGCAEIIGYIDMASADLLCLACAQVPLCWDCF